MRRFLTLSLVLFLVVFLTSATVRAQVCSGDITLVSQSEVDAFNCSEITGALTIGVVTGGSDITDLSPLSGLASVGWGLSINYNASLLSLSGMENLTSVGGSLIIRSNPLLPSLSGLENVVSVGGNVAISYNSALPSLSGLEGLASVSGDLRIIHNDALTSLEGVGNLTSLGASFVIEGNPALPSLLGLEGLTTLGAGLYISESALSSLSGLENVASVGGDVAISYNGALLSLSGLEGLTSVSESVWIANNSALSTCSCGLSGLVSGDPPAFTGVDGFVSIESNDPGGICTSPAVVLANPCEPVANEEESNSPQSLQLDVYPNPIVGPLAVRYALPEAAPVRLAVYDVLGREVAVLADGVQATGAHEVHFVQGGLASGVYVVRLEVRSGAASQVRAQRVTLLQ